MNNKALKNVMIIAGGSGIGKVIALEFLQQGYHVSVADVEDSFLDQIKSDFPQIDTYCLDVSKPDDVHNVKEAVEQKNEKLDVLIQCTGVAGPTAEFGDISISDWDRTIQINVNGLFYSTQAFLPLVRKSEEGSIVFLSSNAAFSGFPYRSPYTFSKWGLIGLTKTLAMELGKYGIRVNAICPGSVEGDRIDRVIAADAKNQNKSVNEIKELYTRQVSLKKFVTAQEIADMCIFLAGRSGRSISGQAIGIDGHTEGLSTLT